MNKMILSDLYNFKSNHIFNNFYFCFCKYLSFNVLSTFYYFNALLLNITELFDLPIHF